MTEVTADARARIEGETLALWPALADPTRRRILDLLAERPRITGEIATAFPISRIAVMRHLDVLAAAGLTTSRKRGRQRWHYVNLTRLLPLHERWSTPTAEGFARALLRFRERVEAAAVQGDAPHIDIALDVALEAPVHLVFNALTREPGAWWGRPFLGPTATGLRIEPRVGGSFIEDWPDGGALLATVTGLGQDRFLQLSGPFHLGLAHGVAEFALTEHGRSTTLQFSFRAFGAIDPELAEQFEHGWRDLVATRLKAFVESDVRLGIDATPSESPGGAHMTRATHLYEDRWGEVIDRPDEGFLEIRWFDTTESMSQTDFETWLMTFAKQVEDVRRPGILIDATRFLINPAHMDAQWRDAHIVPRYNASGVRRFAFHTPDGMPMIGTPPAAEGPATYPTAYFARRYDAVTWLTS